MSLSLLTFTAVALLAAPEGVIAYVSGTEQQDQRIHLLELGSGASRAVGAGSHDGGPAWSPNGAQIAYHSKTDAGLVIRLLHVENGDDRVISTRFGWNYDPQWSTDGCGKAQCKAGVCGRYVIYSSDEGGGLKSRIVVYDTVEETESLWAGGLEGMMQAVWLPTLDLTLALRAEEIVWPGVDTPALLEELRDGGLLAVGMAGSPGALTTELFLVSRSQWVPLLPLLPGWEGSSERYTEWGITPNRRGRRIAFESNDGGNREIFVLHRKGLTNVSNHRAADWAPVWSPDGERLAMQSFRGGRSGIYRIFPDTALVEPVDASPEYSAWDPAWSPDSGWIVYVSDASGDPELYVAQSSGEERKRLTTHAGIDDAPAWRPEVN